MELLYKGPLRNNAADGPRKVRKCGAAAPIQRTFCTYTAHWNKGAGSNDPNKIQPARERVQLLHGVGSRNPFQIAEYWKPQIFTHLQPHGSVRCQHTYINWKSVSIAWNFYLFCKHLQYCQFHLQSALWSDVTDTVQVPSITTVKHPYTYMFEASIVRWPVGKLLKSRRAFKQDITNMQHLFEHQNKFRFV